MTLFQRSALTSAEVERLLFLCWFGDKDHAEDFQLRRKVEASKFAVMPPNEGVVGFRCRKLGRIVAAVLLAAVEFIADVPRVAMVSLTFDQAHALVLRRAIRPRAGPLV